MSSGFGGAQINVLFSVNEYTRASQGGADKDTVAIIDTFFDQLDWVEYKVDKKEVEKIEWGALMNKLNFNERWVYKGSETILTCRENVYQNVLKTIYPIKQRHVNNFFKVMKEN